VHAIDRELDSEVEEQQDEPENRKQVDLVRTLEEHQARRVRPEGDAGDDEERDRRQPDPAPDSPEQASEQGRRSDDEELSPHA
jgi:hypothetical protein